MNNADIMIIVLDINGAKNETKKKKKKIMIGKKRLQEAIQISFIIQQILI